MPPQYGMPAPQQGQPGQKKQYQGATVRALLQAIRGAGKPPPRIAQIFQQVGLDRVMSGLPTIDQSVGTSGEEMLRIARQAAQPTSGGGAY